MEEKQKNYIRQWQPVLETFLTPLDVAEKMLSLCQDFADLTSAKKNLQVKMFMEKLFSSDDENIFDQFLLGLESCEDQKWLHNLIVGNIDNEELVNFILHYENLPHLKKALHALQPHLHSINPIHLLYDMKDVFSESEWHELEATNREHGSIFALWKIIEILPKKDPKWKMRFWKHANDRNLRQSNEGNGLLADVLKDIFGLNDTVFATTNSSDGDVVKEDVTAINEPSTSCQGDLQGANKASLGREVAVDVANECMTTTSVPTSKNKKLDLSQCSTDTIGDNLDNENSHEEEQSTAFSEQNPIESITLKSFQKELIDNTPGSENAIICAPTGCGKTLVAAHLIQKTMEKVGNSEEGNIKCKVLFLAPSVALVNQQSEKITEYLGHKYWVDSMYGNTEDDIFFKFHKSDIICCTPQIILNAIMRKNAEVSLEDFELLIFDECHHCHGLHPYNRIMVKYLRLKASNSEKLPQVIGLTATLGIGKTTSEVIGKENIIQQCARLDAVGGIITVRDNLEDLANFIASPTERRIPLPDRSDNPLAIKLKEIMDKIIKMVEELGAYVLFGKSPELKNLSGLKKGTFLFNQNCVILERLVENSNDVKRPRDFHACIEYLQEYSKGLRALLELEPCYCIEELQNFFGECTEKAGKVENQTEEILFRELKDKLPELEQLSHSQECQNTYLNLIEGELVQHFYSFPDSRVMLMVEDRKQTVAIRDWINRNEKLKSLGAEYFVGTARGKVNDIVMDDKKQLVIMEGFRDGLHKILVCTNEASGEGIDVQNCNMVLSYNYSKNEIGLVQQKGRVRDKAGKLVKLSTRDIQERDEKNMFKVLVMERATEGVLLDYQGNKQLYLQKLKTYQKGTVALQNLKNKFQPTNTGKEYRLLCRKCRVDVCSSYDIRRVSDDDNPLDDTSLMSGMKYINVSNNFATKLTITEHSKVKPMGRDWSKKNRIKCKVCGKAWGILADWRNLTSLPLVKIDGFRIVDPNNSRFSNVPRQWKLACFTPEFISFDNLVEKLADDDYIQFQ